MSNIYKYGFFLNFNILKKKLFFKKWKKVVELVVEGLLSTGPTPSSLNELKIINVMVVLFAH